ncbi:aldehyde dehydrogenase [Niabella terrae]
MNQIPHPEGLRKYFQEGATRSLDFRKARLQRLKTVILEQEAAIYTALEQDLKKSREEVWLTETGVVLSEINYFLKNINALAEPEKVGTDLLNQPGRSYIIREPLGVVLIIAPWNYPFQLALLPLVGAIAAGNCAVVKPSEFAPETASLIARILEQCFEPNHVSVALGDGTAVVKDLMSRFRFDHIFFTGGAVVGKIIYRQAAEQLIPVTLELGGKNPCVVTASARLRLTARRIVRAKFSNAGQMCVNADYLLVHRSVKESLLEELKAAITDFYGAQPVSSYDYGRIINRRQFDRLKGYLDQARILYGGAHNENELYIAPTIIDVPERTDPVMQEEIFGPILPLISYDTEAEALEIIRRHPEPLAFYIFTSNSSEAAHWVNQVPSGGACINAVAVHYLNRHLPFGGRGNSGLGRYHGKYSWETFSHARGVLRAATWPDFRMAYPSFRGRLGIFKKLLK